MITINSQTEFNLCRVKSNLKIRCNIRIHPDDTDALSNLHTWDMSECTDISYMFKDCKLLSSIAGWDLPRCIFAVGAFMNCDVNQDIGKLDAYHIIDASYMLSGATNFYTFPFYSCYFNHNFARCKKAIHMFSYTKIKRTDIFRSLIVCEDISYMFYKCPNFKVKRPCYLHPTRLDIENYEPYLPRCKKSIDAFMGTTVTDEQIKKWYTNLLSNKNIEEKKPSFKWNIGAFSDIEITCN